MRGHIRRRGHTWSVVIDRGRDESGRRQQKWLSGFRTKREAEQALADALTKLAGGNFVEPSRQTLSDFLREWLLAVKSAVRPGTWTGYRMNLERHVMPRIGSTRLAKLSAAQLNSLYAELMDEGRCDGSGGLSTRTIRYVHAILHRALRDAVRWGKLGRNPADLAEPPKHDRPELDVWTRPQLRRFLDIASADRLYAAWLLLSTTGLRRGELLGLRWRDIDLEGARLAVRQSLGSVGGKLTFAAPKTPKSQRRISLDPATVDALRAYGKHQAEERAAWGSGYHDSDLVFCQEDGSPLRPDSVSRSFHALIKKAGLPEIRLHDVRHTYATIAQLGTVAFDASFDVLEYRANTGDLALDVAA